MENSFLAERRVLTPEHNKGESSLSLALEGPVCTCGPFSRQRSASSRKPIWFGGAIVKAMYQFAIDMGEENSYSPKAPQGVEAKVFEKRAISH
jgi:hypothetical protein